MRTHLLVAALAAMSVGVGAPVSAHHSFAATYLEGESTTVEGEIVEFVMRNPHSFVHLNVKQKDGSTVRYVVEWGSPAQLAGKINRDTLKPGDFVVITGNPPRNPSDHRVRLVTFKRPSDGWTWGLNADEKFER